MNAPSPYELWKQSGEDGDRYRALLREHGMLVPLAPGETAQPLPCGWPHRRVARGPVSFEELLADQHGQFDPDGLMLAAMAGADDPAPTTGPPFVDDWPEGCICYLREDPDWGEVYTRPGGQLCPVHDCSCGILTCRVHPSEADRRAGRRAP